VNELEENKREQKRIEANIRLEFLIIIMWMIILQTLRPVFIAASKPGFLFPIEIHTYLEKVKFSKPDYVRPNEYWDFIGAQRIKRLQYATKTKLFDVPFSFD